MVNVSVEDILGVCVCVWLCAVARIYVHRVKTLKRSFEF